MTGGAKIPRLITWLYGPSAGSQHLEDPRLVRWAGAFEAWLAELQARFKPAVHYNAAHSWERLARQVQKGPWELEAADIERHVQWMFAEGYSNSSVSTAVGWLAKFYRWCQGKQVDPGWVDGTNPAAAVKRPQVKRFDGAALLSREEADLLLRVMRRDETPLGKRDFAFVTCRLRMGVPHRSLQRLTWGQVEIDSGLAWVRWAENKERVQMPQEAWEAIHRSLEASGRIESMEAGSYVFAPLKRPASEDQMVRQEAWAVDRYIAMETILRNIKPYAKAAGIPLEKVTLRALRRTAVKMEMEAGKSVQEVQAFMDSITETSSMKSHLEKMPDIPPAPTRMKRKVTLPDRSIKLFPPGHGLTHGLYAKQQPPEELREILAEGMAGLDEEVGCLRVLGRMLLHRQETAESRKELIDLMEAYLQVARRLGEMIRLEQAMDAEGEENEPGSLLQAFVRMREMDGEPVDAEEYRQQVLRDMAREKSPVEDATRQVTEEVAALRLVLRRVSWLASRAVHSVELVRLANLYGLGCIRLVKLLRVGVVENDQVDEFLMNQVFIAIDKMHAEAGHPAPPRDTPYRLKKKKRRR